MYAIAEFAIGAYALLSLSFFDWAVAPGGWLSSAQQWHNAAGGFVILLTPTVMMGMTLPLLTLIFNKNVSNIGYSVGTLYFINTFGAAVGTLVTTFLFFDYLTLSTIVKIMASINFMIAVTALFIFRKNKAAQL